MSRKLNLGLIPSVDPATMIAEAEPFMASLRAALGVEMEAVVPKDYDAVGAGLASGDIDIGFIGPAGYVVARDAVPPPVEPVARGVLDVGGSSWGKSLIVARTNTDIGSVKELRGASFAFSDRLSTSGYFMPYRALAEAGVNPETDLASSIFTGSLGASLRKVADGEVDAAGIGDEILELAVLRGEIDPASITTIHTSAPIPGSLFVLRTGLDEVLRGDIRLAILAMRNMPFCKIGLIREMEPASDAEYDIVREELLGFERCRAAIAANSRD